MGAFIGTLVMWVSYKQYYPGLTNPYSSCCNEHIRTLINNRRRQIDIADKLRRSARGTANLFLTNEDIGA